MLNHPPRRADEIAQCLASHSPSLTYKKKAVVDFFFLYENAKMSLDWYSLDQQEAS